jgi:crossover junction endodeoxyribonuclease RuvC
MIVVGIDPGTATTGYGFIHETPDGTLQAIDYGVILTPAGMAAEKRLKLLYEQLNKLILFHRPHEAAVEKLFFQKNVKTAIAVGQARGVIMLALAQVEIDIGEYTPLEVKQAVAGYGGADKKQVQEMVKALLLLDAIPKPDDAADALAIAICHLNSRKINNLYRLT